MNYSRRNFIKTGLVASVCITSGSSIPVLGQQLSTPPELCIFSKCLQFLDYSYLAEVIADLGFDGVDLAVRKGGHVSPETIREDLPKAVKELHKVGKSLPMIVTDINDASDPFTENLLSIASSLGIKYYRMGRLRYDHSYSLNRNLDNHKRTIENLEMLNRRYKMHGCCQNHSGPYSFVGGPVWDLHYLLKDFGPEFIGVQYDIMHSTVEGGYSWPLGLELLAPWIRTIDIKDFIWEKGNSGKWEAKITPLSEGMVDFAKFIKEINRLKIKATFSLHCEYNLGGAENGSLQPEMEPDEIYSKIKRDLSLLKKMCHSL